jgi:AbrB family transcriptional regulator (stage V sporulation protein T)
MEFTSIIKKIDNLGRIVLPKDLRNKLKLKENDDVEIVLNNDGTILLKKYLPLNEYENECKFLLSSLEKQIDSTIIITDNIKVILCSNKKNNEIIGVNLSKKYIDILESRKIFNEKIMPSFKVLDNEYDVYSKVIVPIIVDSSVIGTIAILSDNSNITIKEKDIELLKFVANILSEKIKQ